MSAPAKELVPLRLDGVTAYPEDVSAQYRERGYWIGQTHSDLLAKTVSDHADRVAVIDSVRTLTYAQLGERVQLVAGELASRGIGRGDRVVVHLPNTVEFVEIVFGLFELGALPVFALAAHRLAEIRQFCADTSARAYVTVDRVGLTSYRDIAADIARER